MDSDSSHVWRTSISQKTLCASLVSRITTSDIYPNYKSPIYYLGESRNKCAESEGDRSSWLLIQEWAE
jgi:hypothetical protein